ncbi:type 1 glutamine amidotransferase domain-containing protein [Planococcus sp. 1R117A]|uniref:type 1 glutamine amidotransferase domain-containing protein n=1 Tax=Planococcus sp. 1R117A TaxID=3447020 RepID=UPI003EDC2453
MDKILIVVTNHSALGRRGKKTGLWLRELTDFYHEVRDLFEVDIISTSPQRVPLDPRSLLEVLTNKKTRAYYMNDELMDQIKRPLTPDQVDGTDYAAIYFAGGHGTMWDFLDNKQLQELTKTVYEKGGIVSAVCHGPCGLLNVQLSDGRYLLSGHVVTGFSNQEEKIIGLYKDIPYSLEDSLRERGTLFKQAALPFTSCVILSGRLITGQNPASARGVALKVIEQCRQQEEKEYHYKMEA